MRLRIYYLITILLLLIFDIIYFIYIRSVVANKIDTSVVKVSDGYVRDVIYSLCNYLTIDGSILNENILLKSLDPKINNDNKLILKK